MELIPIYESAEENEELLKIPECRETVMMSVDFYKKVGFVPPWIGYVALLDGEIVGAAGVKGRPVNSTIEIGYGTFDRFQKQGIGTIICRELVELCLRADPAIRITARTLQDNLPSIKILEKNHFILLGTVNDPQDGLVWEWEYRPDKV